MAAKFLDKTGLTYFLTKIKTLFLPKTGGTLNGSLNVVGTLKRNALTSTPQDTEVPTVKWVKDQSVKIYTFSERYDVPIKSVRTIDLTSLLNKINVKELIAVTVQPRVENPSLYHTSVSHVSSTKLTLHIASDNPNGNVVVPILVCIFYR